MGSALTSQREIIDEIKVQERVGGEGGVSRSAPVDHELQMALIEWSDRLSVGCGWIDTEHRRLIDLLNGLHEALNNGAARERLGLILDGLVDYTVTHFAHEESEMARQKYPLSLTHHIEHADLTRQVLELQASYRAGEATALSLEVMWFLRDWLSKHILETDLKLGAFLRDQQPALPKAG
jgi:hemerythrin